MPYVNLEQRREYDRNYKRQQRTGLRIDNASNLINPQIRIRTAQDVLILLEETINQVKAETTDTLIKARCIGFLASITLKAVETANLEGRLEALEETLKLRRENK